MSVKVVIKRQVSVDKIQDLAPLLRQLRSLAAQEQPHISGETLKRVDGQDEYLVISTWQSLDDWNRWFHNEKRISIQAKIDALLGEPTEYAVYQNV